MGVRGGGVGGEGSWRNLASLADALLAGHTIFPHWGGEIA